MSIYEWVKGAIKQDGGIAKVVKSYGLDEYREALARDYYYEGNPDDYGYEEKIRSNVEQFYEDYEEEKEG